MTNSAKVNELFSQWATSFSGCDGGDLKAPIWFCGIEDGGDVIDIKSWGRIDDPLGQDDNARGIFFFQVETTKYSRLAR
jgi:hypothetical protein